MTMTNEKRDKVLQIQIPESVDVLINERAEAEISSRSTVGFRLLLKALQGDGSNE